MRQSSSQPVRNPCDRRCIGYLGSLARNVFTLITYSISIRTIHRVHIATAQKYTCIAATPYGIFHIYMYYSLRVCLNMTNNFHCKFYEIDNLLAWRGAGYKKVLHVSFLWESGRLMVCLMVCLIHPCLRQRNNRNKNRHTIINNNLSMSKASCIR